VTRAARYRPRPEAPPPRTWARTTLLRLRRAAGAEDRISLSRVNGAPRLVVARWVEGADGLLRPSGPADFGLEDFAAVAAALELARRALARNGGGRDAA
jgi:hypothetical protein